VCPNCETKQEEIDALIQQQDVDASAIRELESTNDTLTQDNARLREQIQFLKEVGNDLSVIAVSQMKGKQRKQAVS
jgi:hypothetical protein